MTFEELLFDDFEEMLNIWSNETGKIFYTEELEDDTIRYVYDNDSFRRWYHKNYVQIDRDIKLKQILK